MPLGKIRLLPVTIAGLSAVLLLKTVILVQAVAGEASPKADAATPQSQSAPTNSPKSAELPSASIPSALPPPETPHKAASLAPPPVPSAAADPAQVDGPHVAAAPRQPVTETPSPQAAAPAAFAPSAPASAAPASAAASTSSAADAPPVSTAERSILLDLRRRRELLEAREKALDEREAEIKSADRRLSDRVEQMGALQSRLETLEAAREQHKEENWRGLVKVYEQMKPRDAATIFDALDMQVLLQVLDRMQERKVAPILAAMQPDRARLATQMLAEMRLRASLPPLSPSPPPAAPASAALPSQPVSKS